MSRPRIRIAHLLIVVLASGAAMGALKTPTPLVASAVFTAMICILMASVACALRASEPARAFWLGFALFGWIFAALSFGPGLGDSVGPHLVTRQLLEAAVPPPENLQGTLRHHVRLYPMVGPALLEVGTTPQGQTHTLVTAAVPQRLSAFSRATRFASFSSSEREQFVRIGEALCVLGVALLGGLFTRFTLGTRGENPRENDDPKTGGAT